MDKNSILSEENVQKYREKGMILSFIDNVLFITGKTYPYKTALKSMGFKYNAVKKGWYKLFV